MFKVWTKNGFIVFSEPPLEVGRTSLEENRKNQKVHFINAFSMTIANRDSNYFSTIVNGTCYCDSRIISAYSKLVGRPISQTRGVDFMRNTLFKSRDESQLIIGSQDYSSQELSDILGKQLNADLNISNFNAPFTSDMELLRRSCLEFMEVNKPKIVWVAIGTPKQDVLAYLLSQTYMANYYCVGAAVSFLTGEISECPKWLSSLGLEWFYRFLQEPKRLWRRYLLGNFRFFAILLADLVNRVIRGKQYLNDELRNV